VIHVSLSLRILSVALVIFGTNKADFEICSGTEILARAGEHDNLYARVDVYQLVNPLHVLAHLIGEGIALLRSVERDEDDGRRRGRGFGDVGDFDLLDGQVGVGVGNLEGRWWFGRHLDVAVTRSELSGQ
jgi:hypothetical protein